MNPGEAERWPTLDQTSPRQIAEEALRLCSGDAALWLHHLALLEGEHRARIHSLRAFAAWRQSKLLPQYKEAESSVVEGWRRFVENTLRIPRHRVATRTRIRPSASVRESTLYLPREQQADDYAINWAIILEGCRRAKNQDQVARLLENRADAFRTFAASGDVAFFRSLGRLLSPLKGSSLGGYEYANITLRCWLTSYLWLMRERTASDLLAQWCGFTPTTAKEGDRELRHFNATKHYYRLKSHNPSLIDRIASNGDLVATPKGCRLFASLNSAKP